jgi:hypothetical protein
MSKNTAKLDPLFTAAFYGAHFDGGKTNIVAPYKDQSNQSFDFVGRIDHQVSSLAASIFFNKADNHAVLFFKGTDLPIIRNEGSGRIMGFLRDIKAIFQSRAGKISGQINEAENIYQQILEDPRFDSVEIVGYSVGSQPLNFLAAKHGAVGTAIADMGIHPLVLSQNFQGDGSEMPMKDQMQKRVSVLHLAWDKLPKLFSAGESVGTLISLDNGKNDFAALIHVPQIYAAKARAFTPKI